MFRFNVKWLQHKWFLIRCRIHWKIQSLSPSRRYYVRISKTEKDKFVNITIYPPEEHDWSQPYDTTIILKRLIERMEKEPCFLRYGNGGFIGDSGSLWLISNCFLARTQK